jgi:hypothetical protein
MHQFLESIQYSEFGLWVAGGDTIFAFPTILMLHTIGLGIVVGMNTILDCRVLGMGREVLPDDLRGLFPIMWWGFGLNAVTGVVLFIAAAADKAYQTIFWVKLVFIVVALLIARRLRRTVFDLPSLGDAIPRSARLLAVASLCCWSGAIVAGRLMAYTLTF